MKTHHHIWTRVTVVLTLLVAGGRAVAQVATTTSEVLEEAKDKGWPRQFEAKDHFVWLYQPQIDEWPNFDRIHLRAALAVTSKQANTPAYGIIVMSAETTVAFEERLVVLTDRKVETLEFPDSSTEEAARLKQIVMEAMPPQKPQTVSLDRLIANVDLSKTNVRKVDVNLAPPKIYASEKPAVMVIFLGKPRFKPVSEASNLMFAVNTNWDVFFDPGQSKYYLLNESTWLVAPDVEKGPWTPTMSLSAELLKLPTDDNWADVRAALPAKPANQVPVVFVSREPAELIVTQGAPEMEPIPGTRLMLVTNTESDLLYHGTEKQFYLLAAGRWFKAPALAGPWSASSTALPEDFNKIPDDSDAASVLASVPGTPQANEAVIMASIPNKATVNTADVTVNVTYTGTPEFRPIETTTVQYAYNTPFSVFLVDGRYYCCNNAVWFYAATPTGPWSICTSVPPAIYTIPPTSPKYNVTYVYVYDSTPTTVTTGYTAGYTGAEVAATGAVMFGLGILVGAAIDDDHDDCWYYHHSSCFYSYGCGARWYGGHAGYVSAGRVYGPYGGAGGFAAYNPSTGFYSRGAAAYGPRGAAGYRSAYNPSTGAGGFRAGATTPYGSWSRGAVTNGDDWVRGGSRSGARGSAGAIQTSEGSSLVHAEGRYGNGATVGRTKEGDIYAGKDGNVYKKGEDGWQQQRSSQYDSVNSQRSNQTAGGQPAKTGAQRSTAGQSPRASADQSQYLQQQSASRQRGESNARRASQSASRTGGGGRSGGGGRRR